MFFPILGEFHQRNRGGESAGIQFSVIFELKSLFGIDDNWAKLDEGLLSRAGISAVAFMEAAPGSKIFSEIRSVVTRW